MKREIKFRGKTVDGVWLHGDLCQRVMDTSITYKIFDNDKEIAFMTFPVLPNTIGQFTGLHDKNGKEIYEGDIVSFTADKESKNWVRPIKWLGAGFTFGDIFPLNYPSGCYEIVGNIHDNPELLSTNHSKQII